MDIGSAELLGEILQRAEQSVLPALRKRAESLIDIFNHDTMQRRIKEKLEEANIKAYSRKLQEIIHQCKTSASLFDKLRSLKDLLQNIDDKIYKLEVISFVKRISNTGFIGLVSDDNLNFLTDKKLDLDQKVDKFFKYLEDTREPDVSTKRQAFEEYITSWKVSSRKWRLSEEDIMKAEAELRDEFNKASLQNCELISQDQFLNEIKSRFEPLREILVKTRETHGEAELAVYSAVTGNPIKTGAAAGVTASLALLPIPVVGPVLTLAGLAVTAASAGIVKGTCKEGLQNMKSKSTNAKRVGDASWYRETSDFISTYLKGDTTDAKLLNFINVENLEPDLKHFNKYLDPWLYEVQNKIIQFQNMSEKSYKFNKEIILGEIERMWRFLRAVILNNPDLADEHQRMMTDMIRDAANRQAPDLKTSILPWISFGQLPLPDGTNQRVVQFKFILSNSVGHSANKVVNELETLFQNAQHTCETNENDVCVIKMDIKIEDTVADKIARLISRLADLQIRGVLIGEYGLGNFRHAMNPAYNRIYSLNAVDKADEFIPTYYSGSLDRGGEPYFCPNGWRRYSINVGLTEAEFERKYGDWPVAYHGTEGHVAMSILLSGIRASGHGCFINEEKGEGAVYLSPSIEYSGHERYAGVWQVNEKYVQMVLQVRVNKILAFQRKPETLLDAQEKDTVIDPNFPDNNELEWVIKWPPHTFMTLQDGILVYGIMLRVSDQHPRNLPQNAWWAKV